MLPDGWADALFEGPAVAEALCDGDADGLGLVVGLADPRGLGSAVAVGRPSVGISGPAGSALSAVRSGAPVTSHRSCRAPYRFWITRREGP